MKGTGSILLMTDRIDKNKQLNCDDLVIGRKDVRFLDAKEIANLHCFPQDFEFPQELTQLQKYRLIGNSLNVLIVSVLIKLLINI
jgi:tRNA (cytosine38-C5)-methyltransferase